MTSSASDADADAAGSRHVTFEGAQVIEYDAELAPVVKLCGASGASDDASVALECQARGLGDSANTVDTLTLQYVQELQRSLRQRGFEPMSDDLHELQTQRRVVELLLLWATSDAGAVALPVKWGQEDKENQTTQEAIDMLDPLTLWRAQLATKQLQGRVDDGYAFGRRFLSVATYVETLGSDELLVVAKQRGLQPPKLGDKQRAAVKALDRELLGLYGTAEGRPLRSLTLRQLVTEAEAREMLGPGGETARDAKGKKSKRAWVDLLRPVMVAEVRAAKIREQEEELLREKLVQELEQEKQREQHERVVRLIEAVMQQPTKGARSSADCAEPEDDDSTLGNQNDNQDTCKQSKHLDEDRKYLKTLVKSVCIPSEEQGDVVMTE
ncbi:Cytochrome P450 86A2 [Phytophthora cinnamomi]|uniref:Cytochrome P450 86A2 n=1 Tax=Phytophthora cinnamomi TaxID=4785 RepID=UPI003559F91A|nr:Cytochrome P450 86A2 [Phytophthora cinnamomi]